MGAYGSGIISGGLQLASVLSGGPAAFKPAQLSALDPIQQGQTEFLKQGDKLNAVKQTLNEADDLSNRMFQQNIDKFAPEFLATNKQIGSNAADMLAGKVPLGGAFNTGYGGRGLTSRDLGMTSDDLMTAGAGMSQESMQGAQAYSPFHHSVLDTLITPGALLAREDAHKYKLNDLMNQQNAVRAKASGINPIMSGISGAMGSLMGGMGGGGGGGGGGGMGSMLGGLMGGGGGGGGMMSMLSGI